MPIQNKSNVKKSTQTLELYQIEQKVQRILDSEVVEVRSYVVKGLLEEMIEDLLLLPEFTDEHPMFKSKLKQMKKDYEEVYNSLVAGAYGTGLRRNRKRGGM